MKRRIIFRDNINKKIEVREFNTRNLLHLDAQIHYPARVFSNKRKKKPKYKHKIFEED